MAVSIKDIARLAGVSHSTVSRALRGSPLIPADTALRIQRIASETGYTASAIARSLVTRKTHVIGIVVTTIADPFNGEVVAGIEETANQHGYSVILANSQAESERELTVARLFQEQRVDGIIVASSRVGALYQPLLVEIDIPLVLLNNQHPSKFIHSVSIDNYVGALEATRHLLALGHRRIAYVGDNFGLDSDIERFRGFRKAMSSAGLSFSPESIVRGDGKPERAAKESRALFALKSRPTAIFCYNDMSALGVMKEAARHGLRVPEHLSVAGFDDLFFAELLSPALTTVRQPKRELGRRAMQLLLDVLAGNPIKPTIRVKGELIVRDSTAPPTRRSGPGKTRSLSPRNTAGSL
ncbi:MAG: LacI family DNA-binding transcriptional regulator [Acidobacteriaceae bacterium]|nr:LacI family DNA-binding transcriptional regulator [Acidobacteriaceae bacterium]